MVHRRYQRYAAKWRADVVREGLNHQPTDENMACVFAHCARAPRADEYPAIRDAIEHWTI